MFWFEHVVLTRLIFGKWSIWAIAPDVPMVFLHLAILGRWQGMEESFWTDILYRVPHSLVTWAILVISVPAFMGRFTEIFMETGDEEFNLMASAWLFHIFCDVFSHKGAWSMRLFHPVSSVPLKIGLYDWWPSSDLT